MRRTTIDACALAVVLFAACDGPSAIDDAGSRRDAGSTHDAGSSAHDAAIDATTPPSDAGGDDTLSARHPGDVGLAEDPAVVWVEDFEEGSIDAIAARYDDARGMSGHWELVTDAPSGTALALTAGAGTDAVDFFKQLPDADEWYVRWYARYDRDVPWHHSGVWFGGYNPSSRWPSPGAGTRPNGDDRFSVSIEPVFESPSLRFDFYDYWMTMRSWMDPPADDGTSYYGNTLVHRNDFTVDEETWVCLEVHLRLNPDPSSGAGAALEVWKNDGLIASFGDAGPSGYWVRDKFCPADADGAECTDYAAPPTDRLDLQMRSTTDLHLNAFWPQNYITDAAEGTLAFDQMVVATARIGCMR